MQKHRCISLIKQISGFCFQCALHCSHTRSVSLESYVGTRINAEQHGFLVSCVFFLRLQLSYLLLNPCESCQSVYKHRNPEHTLLLLIGSAPLSWKFGCSPSANCVRFHGTDLLQMHLLSRMTIERGDSSSAVTQIRS